MARKTVISLSSVFFLLVIIKLIAVLYFKHSSAKENPTKREENVKNASQVLTGIEYRTNGSGEVSRPSYYRPCFNGYSCLPTADCHSRHSTSDALVTLNCSAADGYVCCPPVTKRFKMQIRDPEMNKRLLPIDDCGQISDLQNIDENKASPGMLPWMALLAYRSNGSASVVEYNCGGTLISTRYVLTAAHCVNETGIGKPVHVRLGDLDLTKEKDCLEDSNCAVDVEIEKIIAHKNYSDSFLKNDIALLRLKTEVNLTQYILPICLPFNLNMTDEEETYYYTVAGWGQHKEQNETTIFRNVVGVPVSECDEVVTTEAKVVNELQLCAGKVGGKDACKGDGGGPLMKNFKNDITGVSSTYQLGIVSFGSSVCGTGRVPSVYTRVSAYLSWILSNLEP